MYIFLHGPMKDSRHRAECCVNNDNCVNMVLGPLLTGRLSELRRRCDGLCRPVQDMKTLHGDIRCRKSVSPPLLYLHSYPSHEKFEEMWVAA